MFIANDIENGVGGVDKPNEALLDHSIKMIYLIKIMIFLIDFNLTKIEIKQNFI